MGKRQEEKEGGKEKISLTRIKILNINEIKKENQKILELEIIL